VLVLCESGRGTVAALDAARELVEFEDAELTVVAVAPRAASGARCGNSALEYNAAVAAAVWKDLDDARERLGPAGADASYTLLIEDIDPPLDAFAAMDAFDLVLLPARRWALRAGRHPAAARLTRMSLAEVRVIDPRRRPAAHA
jgi:hypothetical protein